MEKKLGWENDIAVLGKKNTSKVFIFIFLKKKTIKIRWMKSSWWKILWMLNKLKPCPSKHTKYQLNLNLNGIRCTSC